MASVSIYLTAATLMFVLGLISLLLRRHLLRKILALNLMASSVFLVFVVLAYRPGAIPADPDPVPHALVLTGIVVSFSATALAVALARRVNARTGQAHLPEEMA